MEHDCPPIKRRKTLHTHETNGSGSDQDPTLRSPRESKNAFPDDEKESVMEDSQIDHSALEQESGEGKNEIVMEESKLDMSTKSKMDVDDSSTKLDGNKESDIEVMNGDNLPPKNLGSCGDNGHSSSRKKLLVLDINGLLVDIVLDPAEGYKPDTIIGAKAVFKRPYCDEFLKFCFERFDVGVWTSRTRRNIERVLDFLMKDTRHQLLFCWDQSHCTETGFNTIDNSDKPLVLKELNKLWEKQDPNLPFDKGVYDESNTLLLDDSPYKALRNPPYTAIFPYTYSYRNTKDSGLGPNGDLRNYLEMLAASNNVQKFIEQNPFGQLPITYNNESWKFYHKVIGAPEPEAGPSRFRKKLLVIDLCGLLVDVTAQHEGYRADTIQGHRAVFKRPYCDEFWQFCFDRFNVGVWTSTARRNIEQVIDFVMGDAQHKLLFCWDRSHCTDTGFPTVENISKTLLLKELRKLWEKKDPNLPWEIGEYDESNTLLLEIAPHKALLNPPHTAIFYYPYRYWMTEDNSLGHKGDLRVYLERLAACDHVQKFVQENPYGQRPIREKNLSWGFYQKVIRAFSSSKSKADANGSVVAQCKSTSQPETDATVVLAASTLLETNTDTTSATAALSLLEPKTDATTGSVAPTLLEPNSDTTTVSAAPTLLEPKIDTTTVSAADKLLEPETDTTTAAAAPTLLEPKTKTTTDSAAQTLLEPKADTTTVSIAPNLLEPETKTTTVLAAPTLLEPEAKVITELAAPILLEPETDTTTDLAAQSSVANDNPTSLEPDNDKSSGK